MCYSVRSSLITTIISLISIIYLITSNIPNFQWLGISLIGWCGMQFNELLLWLTNPIKECTIWNEIITMTLIPLVLMMQPLSSLWGSLYVFSWKKSNDLRKLFMIMYTFIVISIICIFHFYKPTKLCTIVTKKGHLNWLTKTYLYNNANLLPLIWAVIIILPLFIFWNKNYTLIILLCILPLLGFIIGEYTDSESKGSIWCYYTSYSSIICSIALFLQKNNIYHII